MLRECREGKSGENVGRRNAGTEADMRVVQDHPAEEAVFQWEGFEDALNPNFGFVCVCVCVFSLSMCQVVIWTHRQRLLCAWRE